MLPPLLSPLPILSFLLLFLLHYAHSSTPTLKLRLRHISPSQSPSQALSSDTHRLSILFSSLYHHRTIPQLPLTSGASTGAGQYFVDLHLGTPPQKLVLVADTGSDLIWVTCSACRNCSSRPSGSAFRARHSSTFSLHHCYDTTCRLVPHPVRVPCNHTRAHSPCRYSYSYSDGSLTSGFFARETSSFNTSTGSSPTKLIHHKNLSFGCGLNISGPSVTGPSFNGAQGVMGLGRGPISFASQLGVKLGNKFSYCLMDYTLSPPPTSYLKIGGTQNGAVRKRRLISYTPLQTNALSPTFYYVRIRSVYVGNAKLQIRPSVFAIDELGNGGTIIDSGTTLTFLPDPAYRKILAAFKRRVKLPSPAQPTLGFDLCVNVSGIKKLSLPKLSFKLAGNSVLSAPPGNYFIDTADDIKCLALQPVVAATGFSVIGNLMQQGFLFEFDSDRSLLGFTRHGCAIP